MRRLRRLFTVLLVVAAVAAGLLAAGVRPPWSWFGPKRTLAQPRPLPPGDQEMAWIHTTTNFTTWERFVTGLKRVEMTVPGVRVDDADAFPDQSTAVPEVVIGRDGRAGKLRVRWYKLTSDVTPAQWIVALAERDPAPLAVIGGGSSDRALDLARELADRTEWKGGDRPLLLITTATADAVAAPAKAPGNAWDDPKLIDVYDGRSFRFCFTNSQMAQAVIDFVFSDPTLKPGPILWPGLRLPPLAAAGPWAALAGLADGHADAEPTYFSIAWQDDPYSVDLSWQFRLGLYQRFLADGSKSQSVEYNVPFSVGSFYKPNRYEAAHIEAVARMLPPPGQRSLLVLPTTPPPARRFMRSLCEADPPAARRLVAVTGDGIGMNVIYRDGEFAWPVRSLPMPLVLFTHNDPFAWDGPNAKPPPGYALLPPNSTEDALHFTELGRLVAEAAFPTPAEAVPAVADGVVTRADVLAERLRVHTPAFFDRDGNRMGGTGEYVVVLRPSFAPDGTAPDATVEVHRRGGPGKPWARVRTPLSIYQQRRPDVESAGGPGE